MALFSHSYDDGKGNGFEILVIESGESSARLFGKGTMEVTKQYVAALNQTLEAVPCNLQIFSLVDASELSSTVMRAQFLLGKWLLSNRQRFSAIAVAGAKPWERKLGTMIFKVARIDVAKFFEKKDEAQAWVKSRMPLASTSD